MPRVLLSSALALLVVLGGPAPAAAVVNAPVLKWDRGGCFASWCQTGWYSSPAVADLDGDGLPEVIWGSYDVVALDGATGSLVWRGASGARVWPGIAVADLTGDGTLEVIVGRGSDTVTVYNRFGVVLWTRNPFGGGEIRTLAVEDLESDGQLEIIVGRAGSGATRQLSVYEPNGSVRPGWPARHDLDPGYGWGMYNENVTVADLDGDGFKEIIGPTDTHYITALDRNGNQLSVNAIYAPRQYWSQVGVHVDQAADLRGYAECGTEHRPNFANSAPAIADVDGDGTLEIVVVGDVYNCGIGDPDGDLYHLPWILKRDRTRWSGSGFDWTVIPTAEPGSGPLSQDYSVIQNGVQDTVVADLDGDGRKEILYSSYDGRVHAFWLDKTEHGSWPYDVPGSGIRFAGEPIVADLDNDGHAEVIFTSWPQNGGGRVGRLHILSDLGVPLHEIDLPSPFGDDWNGGLAAPTLANIDGDADLELLVGTVASGVVAYDLPGTAGARVLWGTGRGGYKRTGAARPDPSLRVADLTVSEGSGGATNAVVTVTLEPVAGTIVTVPYSTADGTALAGSDYTAVSGTLTFPAGTATRTIVIPLLPDDRDEPDEAFVVHLGTATGAPLADADAVVTITDDDPPAALSIADAAIVEGDVSSTPAMFTVALVPASGRVVTVAYATSAGSAASGVDYTSASGTLTFLPGETTKPVAVAVQGDTRNELSETFFVRLTGATNATLSDAEGLGTITDDDPLPALSVADTTVAEGDGGPATTFFTITLSQVSGRTVTVDFTTADAGAVGGGDYGPAAGTVIIPEGSISRTVAVPILGDLADEPTESFLLNLAAPSGATLADSQAVGTITDDDALPALSIADVTVKEGNAGTRMAVFTVSLSVVGAQTVVVGYATGDGTARSGLDYLPVAGTLSFPPGTTVRTLKVPVVGDTTDERNEAFLVNLRDPVSARFARRQAQGVIWDDDGAADAYTPIVTVPYVAAKPGRYRLARSLPSAASSGAAITVDADDVLVDLERQSLWNSAGAGTLACGVYARNRRRLTVQGGVLQGFLVGVFLAADEPYAQPQGSIVRGVRALGSSYAGVWIEGRGNVLSGVEARHTGGATVFGPDASAFGLLAVGPGAHVSKNVVSDTFGNGGGAGFGIALASGDGSLLSLNRISDPVATWDSTGLLVQGSANVLASGNRVTNMGFGLVFAEGASGTYRRNVMDGVIVPYVGGTDGDP
jgi:Calx-beta domain/FG-GAP-like repeat